MIKRYKILLSLFLGITPYRCPLYLAVERIRSKK